MDMHKNARARGFSSSQGLGGPCGAWRPHYSEEGAGTKELGFSTQGHSRSRSQKGNSPGTLGPSFSPGCHTTLVFQLAAFGSGFYGPGFVFSFWRLWENLGLSAVSEAIITVFTGEDFGFTGAHKKRRRALAGRVWRPTKCPLSPGD